MLPPCGLCAPSWQGGLLPLSWGLPFPPSIFFSPQLVSPPGRPQRPQVHKPQTLNPLQVDPNALKSGNANAVANSVSQGQSSECRLGLGWAGM